MLDVITDNLDVWTTAKKQKKAVGRGRAKKDEAYGIKKLRELILELAVRGKLVPQDSNDEPACVLLEKIAKEKQRLIEEGKIKKQKSLSEITEEEKSFDLPYGWTWVRLGSLFNSIMSGGTPSKREPEYWGGNIPWASVKDLGESRFIAETQDYITEEGLAKGSKLAQKGNILICTRMGLGKISIVTSPVAFNQDLKAVQLTSYTSVEFFLNTYATLKIKGTGTTVAGIKQEQLLNYVIGLPPLAEQHRIVAKVDELMALCDQLEQEQADHQATHQTLVETLLNGLIESATLRQAQGEQNNAKHPEPTEGQSTADYFNQLIAEHFDTLFTTEQSIEKLKQTILQLAVVGKLVPQDPNDEPANVLLEKIAKEKAKLIKEGKIKKQKSLPEIGEDEKPFELPDGWEWVTLSHLGFFSGGKTPSKAKSIYWDGEIPWVTPKDMKVKHIIESQDHVTQKAIDDGLAFYSEEAILFVVRSGILRHSFPVAITKVACTVNQDLKVLSLFNKGISSYVQLMMKGFEQYILKNLTKSGMTVESIVFDKFSKHYFIFPPIEEQQRIVTKVNQLLSLCDSLKANLNQAQTTQTQLADVIVKQAVN